MQFTRLSHLKISAGRRRHYIERSRTFETYSTDRSSEDVWTWTLLGDESRAIAADHIGFSPGTGTHKVRLRCNVSSPSCE